MTYPRKWKACSSWQTMLLAAVLLWVASADLARAHEPVTEEQMEAAAASPDWSYRQAFMADIQRRNLNRLDEKENYIRRLAEARAAGLTDREIGRRLFGGPNPAFPTGTGPLGSMGDRRILTILVDFPDEPSTMPVERFRQGILGDGGASAAEFFPFDSLRNFYRRASQGKLDLGGNVEGWVRMDDDRTDYKPVPNASDTQFQRVVKDQKALLRIFTEAMGKIDDEVDFSEYDNDNDGDIDGIVFLYAGEPEGWGDFFWAYRWTFFIPEAQQSDAKFDGKRIEQFVFQFIDERPNGDFEIQTLTHEVGHLLGLNDYYDYCSSQSFALQRCPPNIVEPGPDGGVGKFDMMDGNWGNHNAYSRWLLDWIAPLVVGSGIHSVELRSSGLDEPRSGSSNAQDAVAIFPTLDPTSDAPGREMFIVEYRKDIGNDAQAPGDGGIVIWHVAADDNDAPFDTEFDNSYTTPKQLRFIRSNTGDDFGPSGRVRFEDFYVDAMVFGPATTPASIAYDGTHTGVTVSDIELLDDTARMTIEVATVESPSPADAPVAAAPALAGDDPFDVERLAALERALSDLPPEELAERWYALESKLAEGDDVAPADEIEARLVLVKWAQKDGSNALLTVQNSPESVWDATADVVGDALQAYVNASPLEAGDAYLDPESDVVRKLVDETGSLSFVRDAFAARAYSDQDALAEDISRLEDTEKVFSAVRGLRKAGTSLEVLQELESAMETNQTELQNVIELEQSIDKIGAAAASRAVAPDLADQLLKSMQRGIEIERVVTK